MPALEAQLTSFENAHTQVLSISIDSSPVHANFGSSLGGISYPMLSDFHPKGAMAQSYGTYLEDKGFTDRATVIVDAQGIVRHASSIGQRDMSELAKICQEIDAAYGEGLPARPQPPGLPSNAIVYVRDQCAASRSVLLAKTNLGLSDVSVRNVSQDPSALAELEAISGGKVAPILLADGKVVAESADIVSFLAAATSSL